jgi:hypothetical protein
VCVCVCVVGVCVCGGWERVQERGRVGLLTQYSMRRRPIVCVLSRSTIVFDIIS